MHEETKSWKTMKLKLYRQLQLSFLVAVHLWKQIHVPFLKPLCSNMMSCSIFTTQCYLQDLCVRMVLWKTPSFFLCSVTVFAVTVFQNICIRLVLGFDTGLVLAANTKIRVQWEKKRQNGWHFQKLCVLLTAQKEVIGKNVRLRVWPLYFPYSKQPAH